jgi:serine/threonine protein kinase
MGAGLQGFKTHATEKLFNGDRVNIIRKVEEETRYIYELTCNGKSYILKGYSIHIEHLDPTNQESRGRFMKTLWEVGEVFQEYCFAKVGSVFNEHFVKPLIMDYNLELATDSNPNSYLFIEMIYEHGGKSLDELGLDNVTEIYNLMQQSADAFNLLHEAAITHINIKPANMIYNRDTDILKIMDMGISHEYDTMSKLYKSTELEEKLKSLIPVFSPPEILKLNERNVQFQESIPETVDVYSWAMSFYSLLLNKTQSDLETEVNKFKLNDETDYLPFLNEVKIGLKNIKVDQDQEEQKLNIITEELIKTLSYNPDERPKMKDIAAKMKQDILFSSNKQSSEQILSVKEDDNIQVIEKVTNVFKPATKTRQRTKICMNCLYKDKKKVKLECGHCVCRRCILKYVLEKFDKKEKYDHKVMCNICKEIKEISIFDGYIG